MPRELGIGQRRLPSNLPMEPENDGFQKEFPVPSFSRNFSSGSSGSISVGVTISGHWTFPIFILIFFTFRQEEHGTEVDHDVVSSVMSF